MRLTPSPRAQLPLMVAGVVLMLVAAAGATWWAVGMVAEALGEPTPSATAQAEASETATPEPTVDPTVTTITAQPSDTNIPTEGSRKLGVRAEGPDRSYQWQRLKPGLDPEDDEDGWVDIDGATKRTLKVPGADRHDGAHYRVIITTDYERLVSDPALVRVVYPTETPIDDANEQFGDDTVAAAGVDVSKWNRIGNGQSAADAGWSFVIAKVGGSDSTGTAYADGRYGSHVSAARASDLDLGHYWFNGAGDPEEDAEYFVDHLRSYREGDPLVLDIEPFWLHDEEDRQDAWGPEQAAQFLTRVDELVPDANLYVYMSADLTWDADWSEVAQLARLWVAAWGDNTGTVPTNQPSVAHWDTWTIWQFSSWGRPDGYSWSRIDVNLAREDAWG